MSKNNPWAWVPSLYVAEGIPYVFVMEVVTILFTDFKLSNTEIAFYTSSLYLPWVIKPFWSPVVDLLGTKRRWIAGMELLLALVLAGLAGICLHGFALMPMLVLMWIMAFASATHDVAVDGYYIDALDSHQQSVFVGIRSTFYRIATILGKGLLIVFVGWVQSLLQKKGLIAEDVTGYSWTISIGLVAVLMGTLALWHNLVCRSTEVADTKASEEESGSWMDNFSWSSILISLAFLLLFRLSEALLSRMTSPFLLNDPAVGGLGLSKEFLGMAYGTVGIICLTIGGILGGLVISRHGLRQWIWPMALCVSLPNVVYWIMASVSHVNPWLVTLSIAVEQFGYGFGFTAYMMYMIYISRGAHSTTRYAICTGIMALGMMLPGMTAGWIQQQLGYQGFFVVVLICTIPILLLLPFVKIDADFGKKEN